MRHFAHLIVLVLAAAAAAGQAPTGAVPLEVTVKPRVANLRAEPNARSAITGTAKQDENLVVYAYSPSNGWYLVKAKRGRGWIRESLVLPILSTEKAALPDIPLQPGELRGWTRYARSPDGELYMHDSTIERAGDIVRVWSRLALASGGSSDKYIAVDCARHDFVILISIDSDAAGRTTERKDYRDVATPTPISPDSVIFQLSRAVCRKPTVFS